MVDAPERIWAWRLADRPGCGEWQVKPCVTEPEYVRADLVADKADAWDAISAKNAQIARLQEQVEAVTRERAFWEDRENKAVIRAEAAEAERDRLREALEAERAAMDATHRRAMAAEDRVTILNSALREACDQILDSYRTWVADDCSAHPRPGQIPRYDRSLAALQKEHQP